MKPTFLCITFVIVSAFLPIGAYAQPESPLVIENDQINRIVATHPGEDALWVAGPNGLYSNSGDGWLRQQPAPPEGQIAVAGGVSGLLFVGDHPPCMRGGMESGLQRSTDGGATWTMVEGADAMRPLAIWPDPGLALAASCAGPQQSTDDGLTWTPVAGIEAGYEITGFAEVPQQDGSGPVVLLGLTGEGGTSQLVSIDFTDPAAPVVSGSLRDYYAIGGLAGYDDTYVLAAMDGVWISEDAGASWERNATGLEDVVLERDPLVDGLPQDLPPNVYGLYVAAIVPGDDPGLIVGSNDGLFSAPSIDGDWARIEGTSGRANHLVVASDGSSVLYDTEDGVFEVEPATSS